MICVSEVSAAEALEPGLRLPSSRFLPSPDATANDDASRPMITADVSTSVPLELVRSSLRNMGWKASLLVSFPPGNPARPPKVAVGCLRAPGLQRILPLSVQLFSAKIGHGPGTPRSSC